MPSSVVFQVTDKTDRIEAALRKLPIDSEHKPVWREQTIKGIARELALMSSNDQIPSKLREASSDKTNLELACLKELAESMLAALDALHKPAASVLAETLSPAWHTELRTSLRLLAVVCEHADIEETLPTIGRGRPPNMRAESVTKLIVRYYPLLVGRPATITTGTENGRARGPFLDVLAEVFGILGIRASAESQARDALYNGEK